MSSNVQRREHSSPPPLEEGYWESLLHEGEFTAAAPHTYADDTLTKVDAANGHHEPHTTGEHQADWLEIQRIMEADDVIDLIVNGYNRGGLLVEWRGLNGFVPASQLIDFPNAPTEIVRKKALTARVGSLLHLRVIELNRDQNRLIFSERAASAQPGERAEILANLKSGGVVSGQVTNLCDFGAFVDLGGLEGLIHISELSWGRVGHPADLLKRGQTVEAHVLDVNAGAGRIALSLKRLHPDPWATVGQRYSIGQLVEGEITNVVDFGAFARIEDGLEGLIHVSELAEGHFLHPRNVVQEGQVVSARILSIDGRARRLGLSLRAQE